MLPHYCWGFTCEDTGRLLPFLEWAPLLDGRLAALELECGAVIAVGVTRSPSFDWLGPIDCRLTGPALKMLLVEVRFEPSCY